MNKLDIEKQSQVLSCLIEGNSIRSTERMTNTHRDTIMRLLVSTGKNCEAIMNEKMRNLNCRYIQVDEIWAYVQKKQRHMKPEDNEMRVGDQWTFVALDAETKLVPSYLIGKRNVKTATDFMVDLSSRLSNRVQISSDSLKAYVSAIEVAFGGDVDYGQLVKTYEAEPVGPGRYSPPEVVSAERIPVYGMPIREHISTSLIERQNLTMRMNMRRFTRLTNAFSKKLENLKAAVALHFTYYNFCRVHKSLRVTPAMEAGIANHIWAIGDLI